MLSKSAPKQSNFKLKEGILIPFKIKSILQPTSKSIEIHSCVLTFQHSPFTPLPRFTYETKKIQIAGNKL